MIENPLLSNLKLPGRIFQLPSRGLLYGSNVLKTEVQNAELLINAMTAFDEITMKNPDMLFSGKALSYITSACIPGIDNALELYGKDVDALMFYLRLVTYGPNYEVSVTHDCENGKSHSYIIDLEQLLARMKYLDPTTYNDIYSVTLPNGQVVQLQPVKYKNVIELLQDNQGKKELSVDDLKMNLEKSILNVVKSVDGIEDKEMLKGWIKAIPSPYIEKIGDVIEKTNDWGPEDTVDVICKDCGESFKVQISLNPISFF
jgi:hypothetical protein